MENFVSFNWYVAFVSRKETQEHLQSLSFYNVLLTDAPFRSQVL